MNEHIGSFGDFESISLVEDGRILHFDVVAENTCNLIGFGTVAWERDSSVLIDGSVEIFD